MWLTTKRWSEIVVLALTTMLVSGTLTYQAWRIRLLVNQVIDQRREIVEHRAYIKARDAQWEPHVLSIPLDPQARP
jgi:hypothetical protein